jgi:N6-L-threonylcarbamoyladenine synthase
MLDSGDFHFSFSGLKTAVRVFLEKGFTDADLPDICASFQLAVVEVLVAKTFRSAKARDRKIVSMSGGVSANACLRQAAAARAEKAGVTLRFAPDGLRTDNALMIAYAAAHHLAAGHRHPVSEDITPNFDPAALCI